MSPLKKLFKITLLVLSSVVILFGILWILPARTPGIKSTLGTAVSKIDYIKIGGVEQCVLIRSANINNPIILFLHGGPGMPMMYLAHDFQRPLEKKSKPNFETWLFEFGGELKNSKSFFPLIWSGLRASEYTFKEAFSVGKGSSFSNQNMKYNVLDGSIYDKIREYKVPVYFFVGKNDFTTPFELIEDYYRIIKAPGKQITHFNNSAHFPFFEEPEKFCLEVEKVLNDKN